MQEKCNRVDLMVKKNKRSQIFYIFPKWYYFKRISVMIISFRMIIV